MIDLLLIFLIAAAIMIIGFLGNIFFKKTGWPEILFLIAIGVVLGPVLNVFSRDDFLPVLPIFSTFTLLMILFRGGMDLNLSEIISGGSRALLQATVYLTVGMLGVATFLHLVMGWEWIDGFILGSIVSQTGGVVIVHMAKKIEVHPLSAIFLTLESTFTSIFNIVFFLVFLEIRLVGILYLAEAAAAIFTRFSMGY